PIFNSSSPSTLLFVSRLRGIIPDAADSGLELSLIRFPRRPSMFSRFKFVFVILLIVGVGAAVRAQNPAQPLTDTPPPREPLTPAPKRATGEGLGPFQTMVIRGALVVADPG